MMSHAGVRELALRIALGADPMRILSATLGQGALMVGSGLAVGGVLSIWAARALSSVVFATDRLDVLSVGVAAAVLMVAGAGAVLPAARRAARTDPLIALRSEIGGQNLNEQGFSSVSSVVESLNSTQSWRSLKRSRFRARCALPARFEDLFRHPLLNQPGEMT